MNSETMIDFVGIRTNVSGSCFHRHSVALFGALECLGTDGFSGKTRNSVLRVIITLFDRNINLKRN
jgi:hypothetical protein